MNTKAKILNKSREIFNEKGINTTTLRQISLALNMSHGNLNYHFKTKQDIIEALYFELVAKSDNEMELLKEKINLLLIFYQIAKKSIELFYDYRFLLRDWYFIFRQSHKIKSHYVNLYLTRKVQFAGIVEDMIKEGILEKEELPKQYERFFERMNIISENWINDFEGINDSIEHPLAYYQNLILEMIYPYLTIKGKQLYHSIFIS